MWLTLRLKVHEKKSAFYDQSLLRNRAKRFEKSGFLAKLCKFEKTTL